jgi:hypothetical protein
MTMPRPDHPDFWLLSQAIIAMDAQARSGQGAEDIIGRYLDPDSVAYVAVQRAMRASDGRFGGRGSTPQLAGTWIDGLLAGMAVQGLKDQAKLTVSTCQDCAMAIEATGPRPDWAAASITYPALFCPASKDSIHHPVPARPGYPRSKPESECDL